MYPPRIIVVQVRHYEKMQRNEKVFCHFKLGDAVNVVDVDTLLHPVHMHHACAQGCDKRSEYPSHSFSIWPQIIVRDSFLGATEPDKAQCQRPEYVMNDHFLKRNGAPLIPNTFDTQINAAKEQRSYPHHRCLCIWVPSICTRSPPLR